jgi:hypothetical protein
MANLGTMIDSLLDRIEVLENRCYDEADKYKSAEVEVSKLKLDRDGWQRRYFALAEENMKLKQELVRRGADHPDKPKPPCDTAFAALQVVCNSWDREECFQDLRNQREELLRRVRALKSGRELMMNDIVKAMNEDGRYPTILCAGAFPYDLHYTLAEMREQLNVIWEATPDEQLHEEWGKGPLHMLMEDGRGFGHGHDMAVDEEDEWEPE